jgi:hypothetical protein
MQLITTFRTPLNFSVLMSIGPFSMRVHLKSCRENRPQMGFVEQDFSLSKCKLYLGRVQVPPIRRNPMQKSRSDPMTIPNDRLYILAELSRKSPAFDG